MQHIPQTNFANLHVTVKLLYYEVLGTSKIFHNTDHLLSRSRAVAHFFMHNLSENLRLQPTLPHQGLQHVPWQNAGTTQSKDVANFTGVEFHWCIPCHQKPSFTYSIFITVTFVAICVLPALCGFRDVAGCQLR